MMPDCSFTTVFTSSHMQDLFIEYNLLVVIILALVMLANWLRLAYPIVLVLGGLALGFTGLFSNIGIDPELVFFIFLPPLLYEAAWQVSWKEFWKWRRAIAAFAFPVVIINATVVALISSWLIPGFSLALGFLLGGIVSPPDAVSATTIMRRVKVPKVIVTISEGESLLNDASSLIIFRFALAAIVTGQFYFSDAAVSFVLAVVMGTLIGLLVALAFYAVHRWLPTTTGVDVVLTFIAPYFMYYFAEHFHFSGVLAVVSGGLLLSGRRDTMLNYRTRIEGVNVWNNLIFVLNGFVFMLIGLQLPAIVNGLGQISLFTAAWYAVLISFVLIVTRLVCTLGGSVLTTFMSRFIQVAEAHPGWRNPVITGWAGMRGVISLAMALSIPLVINEGQPFPYRELILFITFVVILVTLVFQGLTLPWVIRKVKPEDIYVAIPERTQEVIMQKKVAHASLEFLNDNYADERSGNKHLENLYDRLQIDLNYFLQECTRESDPRDVSLDRFYTIYLEMLDRQRRQLNEMNHLHEFNEELIRKYQALIDIEEYKVHEKQLPAEAME
ncbi:MAG TPA: Na+/H+ antiporter [Pyrinomonadaceae bacterium]|nr:Na+/H+ antiporter [Pyrinomonadaceae bacterium]